MHLNFDGHFTSPPGFPTWFTPLQQQDLQRQGIVVWIADLRVVTHLYAGYALEILEQMRATDTWKSNSLVIGSPMYKLSSETVDGTVTLENQIELAPDQAKDFFDFLNTHKKLMEYIAIQDEAATEDALRTVFRQIAVYGRKVRERKGYSELTESTQPKVLPITIPHGNYVAVYQIAQICNAAPKQIRAWIRKGKLEGLDLPGLGIIIEAGKLNNFLFKKAHG
jgi:hypothetical protein